eukprot:6491078-Amphidinium_carterae.1
MPEQIVACPVCAVASKRRRPHTKLNPATQAGGELSVDLSGPHVLTYMPGDKSKEERGKYLLVAAYSPMSEKEQLRVEEVEARRKVWRDSLDRTEDVLPRPEDDAVVLDEFKPDGSDPALDSKEKGQIKETRPKGWYYVRILRNKTAVEVREALSSVINEINHSFRVQAVWSLHSDQGLEFVAKTVKKFAGRRGLHVTTGPGYDPDSNSRAERAIGIVKDIARRLLADAGLSSRYWGHACQYAAVVQRFEAKGKTFPEHWPRFGSMCTALERRLPRDDFRPRGTLGAYVEITNGRIEVNGTFHPTTLADRDLLPAEEAERVAREEVAETGPKCAACRGRYQPHTLIQGECLKASEVEEEDPDAWLEEVEESAESEADVESEESDVASSEGKLEDSEPQGVAAEPEEVVEQDAKVTSALRTPWLVEMCCSAHSELARFAAEKGWKINRVMESNPLESSDTESLINEVEEWSKRGGFVMVWWALPCTAWSAWQYINKADPSKKDGIEKKEQESLKQQELFLKYSERTVMAGGHVAFEWPTSCSGWKCPALRTWCARADVRVVGVHGCMLGVKCRRTALPLKKPWRIAVTHRGLADTLAPY